MGKKKKGKSSTGLDKFVAIVKTDRKVQVLLVLAILIPVAVFGVVQFGAFFELPPEEFQSGYAIINFKDPFTSEEITGVDIYVQFWNGTNYVNTTSGEAFYVPSASWYFAVKNGFWNTSGSIWAQGNTPENAYIQTYSMELMCPKEVIHISIIAIDGFYGLYNSSQIPDGYHSVTLQVGLSNDWEGNSSWGVVSFNPDFFIPTDSLADEENNSRWGLWIGWNGTISDFSQGGSPIGMYQVYNAITYNSTEFFDIKGIASSLTIYANFKSISNATLYLGFIHDTDRLVIHF